jgi:threonine synthase
MARHCGVRELAASSAGHATGALAAWAADINANFFMPRNVPFANYVEAVAYGANLTPVNGLISDCGRIVAERSKSEGWFDISTLKEPFRVEGKKPWDTSLSSSSAGIIRTPSSILPAVV